MNNTDALENRWSLRKPVEFDINLHFGNRSFRCKVRDMGLGGMFVDLGIAMIPPLSHVVVEVLYQAKGQPVKHQFHSRVAHSSLWGYGLAFKQFEVSDFRVVQDLLHIKKMQALN